MCVKTTLAGDFYSLSSCKIRKGATGEKVACLPIDVAAIACKDTRCTGIRLEVTPCIVILSIFERLPNDVNSVVTCYLAHAPSLVGRFLVLLRLFFPPSHRPSARVRPCTDGNHAAAAGIRVGAEEVVGAVVGTWEAE